MNLTKLKNNESRQHGWQNVLAEWPVLLFLVAAGLLFFWPVWIAGYTFPQGGGDLFNQLYPVWNYVAHWLRQGIFPLWHTGLMAGDPLIAEAQYGLLNPLNWPLFLFSPIPRTLLLLRDAFTLWLAGAGLYLYLRHSPVWGLGRTAALTSGIAYMLSNPFVVHLGHPQFNDVMAWLPWMLWAMDEAMRRRRAIPPAAGVLAALLLAGHGQAALYALLAIAFYGLWQVAEGGWQHAPRRAGRLALVALLGGALAAPAILPGLERLPHTERSLVPWEDRRGYEFPAQMLMDFISPWFHGQGYRFWAPWNRVESGYAGVITLALALPGLVSNWKQRRVWFLLGLGTFAYLFALGYQGPIYAHFAPLPFFSATWKTARIIFLLSFTLAIAAGLGLETLLRGSSRQRASWALLLLGAGTMLWLRAPHLLSPVPAGAPQTNALHGLRLAALILLGSATLIGTRSRTLAHAGIPLLLLAELVTVGAFAETDPPSSHNNVHAEALAYLQADPGWFRVDVDVAARGLWSPSALTAEGFTVPQGTGNPMELYRYNQFYWTIPHQDSPAYQLLGVKYIIVPQDAYPGGEGIWPVFQEDEWIDIHLNTNSLNRVWLVFNTLPAANRAHAQELILQPDFAPAEVAVVENGPILAGHGTGTLELRVYQPHRVAFNVEVTERALFVLSDLNYPGWTAQLDGASTPLYTTNAIFRGVVIPPGKHQLTMRFRPLSFQLGLGAAGMALLLIAALVEKVKTAPKYGNDTTKRLCDYLPM